MVELYGVMYYVSSSRLKISGSNCPVCRGWHEHPEVFLGKCECTRQIVPCIPISAQCYFQYRVCTPISLNANSQMSTRSSISKRVLRTD